MINGNPTLFKQCDRIFSSKSISLKLFDLQDAHRVHDNMLLFYYESKLYIFYMK